MPFLSGDVTKSKQDEAAVRARTRNERKDSSSGEPRSGSVVGSGGGIYELCIKLEWRNKEICGLPREERDLRLQLERFRGESDVTSVTGSSIVGPGK
jgi:hypothetical protein